MSKALSVLAKALGLQINCAADSDIAANVLKIAEELKANGKLTGKQFESLAEMDEEQRGMVGAILGAMGEADKAAAKAAKAKAKDNAADDEEDYTDEEEVAKNKGKAKTNTRQPKIMSAEEMDAAIDKRVTERVEARERAELVEMIKANSANTFDDDELKGMSLSALQKYEKSLRPVDYSGQGGFASHGGAKRTAGKPLLLNHGVLNVPAKKVDAKAN